MDKFFFCRGKGQAPRTWNGLPRWDGRLPECLRLLWCFVLLCCPTAGAEVRTGSPSDSGFRVSQRSSEPVLIDLSKRETFVALSIQADPQDIEITQVEARNLPSSHHLNPRGGVIGYGEPVDIVLKEPAGVRIRLALVTRGDELALRISPQVVLGDGEAIELTQDRIERAARSLQRRIKDLHRRLAALAAARRRLQAWLNSPVNKPLDAVKAARAQLKGLEQELQLQQLALPAAESQCRALQEVAKFAAELHGHAEVRFSVQTRRNQRK